jgi:imidazolonepropionase-like amidohydrolase
MLKACVSIALCVALTPLAQAEIFRCTALFDAATTSVLKNREIVVANGRITAVRAATNEKAVLLDGLCTPGWIDLHTHLTHEPNGQSYTEAYRLNPADIAYRAQRNGLVTLRAGFTTVRDLGDGWGVTTSLRNAINAGTIVGPRVFTVGKSIATTGGHADPTNGTSARFMGDPGPDAGVVNSPDEARKAVRQRYKEGADLIKITATGGVLSVAKNGLNPQFNDAELRAIVETANDYGFTVAAHAHGAEGMKRAVLAGVTSIEHGTMMTEEVMKLMRARGTWYVPTLAAGAYIVEKAEVPGFYVPMVAAKAKMIGPQIQKTLAKAYRYGVPIAFGTDAGVYPHGENAKEFILLHQAGVPMAKALQMATVNAAKVLRNNEIGQIAPNYFADITVVPLDALQVPEQITKVIAVVKNGVLITD